MTPLNSPNTGERITGYNVTKLSKETSIETNTVEFVSRKTQRKKKMKGCYSVKD